MLVKKLGDPFINFVNASGDGPQLGYEHFGDKGQRLNDGRIFSDWQCSGEFFEPFLDQGLAARVMGVVEAAQSFWALF